MFKQENGAVVSKTLTILAGLRYALGDMCSSISMKG